MFITVFSLKSLRVYDESVVATTDKEKQDITKKLKTRLKITCDKIVPLKKLLKWVIRVILISLITVNDYLRSISILSQYEDK